MPGTVSIDTSRLHLRPLTLSDFNFFYRLQSDEQLMRYIRPAETDPEAVKARMEMALNYARENPGLGGFIALDKEAGIEAGNCVLRHVEFTPGNELELGYVIVADYQGRGLATEMVGGLLRYAFERFSDDKVLAFTDPDNLPSQKVLLKCGFQQEGRRTVYDSENLVFVRWR